MEQSYQVIIVGGGPVGVALAVDLGRRGITCALVERHLQPQRIPKGQNLTQRSMEHFYFWGLAEELRAARELPDGYPIGGLTAYRNLASDYWFAPAGRETVRQYYFQANERLPQYRTEEVLRSRLTDFPNVVGWFGWAADAFEQDDDGVQVNITEVGGTERRTLTAEYIVGCDGAHSFIRDRLGLEREGTDFRQRMVLAVFSSKELHQGLARFPDRTTYRVLHPDLNGVWRFFGRVDVGERWFFHGPVLSEATSDPSSIHGLIQEAAGFPLDCSFEHIGFWDLRVAVASKYRKDRAFIAGDAAHSHPPYGAFGLNSGLEDVVNLSWKLDAKLNGWGGEKLLDSYSEERRPIFWETGEDIIAGGIKSDGLFLKSFSPDRETKEFEEAWQQLEDDGGGRAARYEPHYEGSSVIFGPPQSSCSVHGVHSFAARPGHHLAPQLLSSGRNVFEELGTGFTLLALGNYGPGLESFQQNARSLGIPVGIIKDTFQEGRQAYQTPYVLVRPDQYVAWVGERLPEDSTALLRKTTGLN